MAKNIKIKNVEYAVKPGMKAVIIFEKLTDGAFKVQTTTDVLTYIYSSILSGTPETRLDFSDMIDAFDDDPDLLKEAMEEVLAPTALDKIVKLSNEGGPEPKKD